MSSIFFEFNLPNSATWFYFALFLCGALFFQFNRPFGLRNWDLLGLFLFAPGFLLIQEAHRGESERERFVGYVWLLAASGVWFARCLIDLAVAKRPLPQPNMTTPGMVWFGLSLFLCLAAVNYTRPADPWEPVGRRPAAITGVERGAAAVVQQAQAGPDGAAGPPTAEVRFWVERSLAVLLHASVAVALVLIGALRFQDTRTGAAAATLYLLLPYTAYHFGQVHHVWPAALVLWAMVAFRRPTVAGGLVGLAAGTTFFPVLLLPAWVQFYRVGAGRFLAGFGVLSAMGLAVTLTAAAMAGPASDAVWPPLNLADWQPWRVPTAESIWTGAHWAYRVPVFTVYAAFVLGTFFWPPVRNLGELIAASAAVLIGVQFWYSDRGGLYVLWYAPFLVLLVLRPSLVDQQPGVPGPWPRFVGRAARWAITRVRAARPAEAGVP